MKNKPLHKRRYLSKDIEEKLAKIKSDSEQEKQMDQGLEVENLPAEEN